MLGAWWFLFFLATAVNAQEVVCPATVSVRQVPMNVPAGWTAEADANAAVVLKAVTFFDGKPEEEASLVYDRLTKTSSGTRATWSFLPNSHIWLSCSYSGTTVVLSRQLPNVTRCTVYYKRDSTVAGLPEISHISCR